MLTYNQFSLLRLSLQKAAKFTQNKYCNNISSENKFKRIYRFHQGFSITTEDRHHEIEHFNQP